MYLENHNQLIREPHEPEKKIIKRKSISSSPNSPRNLEFHQTNFLTIFFVLQVHVALRLADCDFQDKSIMELLSDYIDELVNDGKLMLARVLRTKFIQKYKFSPHCTG